MMRSFGDVIRWFAAALFIASGLSALRSLVFRSWMGLSSILWLVTALALIGIGVLLFRYRSPTSNTGRLRWKLGFIGLLLLPAILGSSVLLFTPSNAPGFSGVYAAGAVGQALVLSLYVSPIPALAGYLIGLWLDIAKRDRKKSEDQQPPPMA